MTKIHFEANHVIEIYIALNDLGIELWIDGGWGVDALLGRQTRPHADLDLVVQSKDVLSLREYLSTLNYQHQLRDDTRDWNFVLADSLGHEIDIHVITMDANGNGIYGPAENGLQYPHRSLLGCGSIKNFSVQCLSADYQVQSHTGYLIREKDIHDVMLLCERFNINLPSEYQ